MPTPLSRVALRELIEQNLTDPLNQQNTAARVREVFASLVESAPNVVDDLGGAVSPGGGAAGPLYATTGQHTDGPMHQKAVTDALTAAGGAPQWVAGPQKAGALVYDQGLVYRVKQNIANSTSAPAGNPANYEPVGAAAAQDALTPASATKPPSVNAVVAGLAGKMPTRLSYVATSAYFSAGAPTDFYLQASQLNQALEISVLDDVTVHLPAVTLANAPATIWLRNAASNTHAITVRGAQLPLYSQPDAVIRVLQPGAYVCLDVVKLERGYPNNDFVAGFLVSGEGDAPEQVDLLDLTTDQMDAVIALPYTDGDAPLADTPAWSRPGQWFDAKLPGGAYRFTCGRGNYTPGTPGSGVGPRWSKAAKL